MPDGHAAWQVDRGIRKKMGPEVVMIIGDNERTANAITRQVGVDRVVAEVLPQAKAFNV